MLSMLDEHVLADFLHQWGPAGVLLLGFGFVGRWLLAKTDRDSSALLDVVKQSAAEQARTAAINAQTAAVLAALDRRLEGVETDLNSGILKSMGAHEKTHDLLDQVLKK